MMVETREPARCVEGQCYDVATRVSEYLQHRKVPRPFQNRLESLLFRI